MSLLEPPQPVTHVLIGQNSRGQWVAQQQHGLFGGLFTRRADAVRYALFENGQRTDAIISVAGPLELDMGAGCPLPRRVA